MLTFKQLGEQARQPGVGLPVAVNIEQNIDEFVLEAFEPLIWERQVPRRFLVRMIVLDDVKHVAMQFGRQEGTLIQSKTNRTPHGLQKLSSTYQQLALVKLVARSAMTVDSGVMQLLALLAAVPRVRAAREVHRRSASTL